MQFLKATAPLDGRALGMRQGQVVIMPGDFAAALEVRLFAYPLDPL
jgi:hypothetical protein